MRLPYWAGSIPCLARNLCAICPRWSGRHILCRRHRHLYRPTTERLEQIKRHHLSDTTGDDITFAIDITATWPANTLPIP